LKLGDLKTPILGMLKAYYYESNILKDTRALTMGDMFDNLGDVYYSVVFNWARAIFKVINFRRLDHGVINQILGCTLVKMWYYLTVDIFLFEICSEEIYVQFVVIMKL